MAILDTDGTYVKINYENCGVVGGKVYVEYSTYQNELERQKEKTRHAGWLAFQHRCAEKCGELYRLGLERWDPQTRSKEEIEADPQFLKDRNAYCRWTEFLSGFEESVFKLFDEAPSVAPEELMQELLAMGFDPIWMSDPVRMNGKVVVCCGDYDMMSGNVLSREFFYDRLKSRMSESVQNV